MKPRSAAGDGLHHNPVDGHDVPVPHFGVVLTMDRFDTLAERLRAADVRFVIEPYVRFKGEVGEQATMFFLDPSGNGFKYYEIRNNLNSGTAIGGGLQNNTRLNQSRYLQFGIKLYF